MLILYLEVLWGVFYARPWHGVAGPNSLPGVMVFSGSCQVGLLSLLPHPSRPASVWNSIDLLFHLTVNGRRPARPIAKPELSYLFIWSVLPSPVLSLPPQTPSAHPLSSSSPPQLHQLLSFSPPFLFCSSSSSCFWLLWWLAFVCSCSAGF